jgi:hypothetical protein
MINFIKSLFKSKPKYRVAPTPYGGWQLEKYHPYTRQYYYEARLNEIEDAKRVIANLERDAVYFIQKENNQG